jgi:bifunctional oligoribonuclease and PAP phosphatase NrnA
MIWNDLSNAIDRHGSFLISSHLSLDGDCIGSALAFLWYLTSRGKSGIIYNHDPVPEKFIFLKNAAQIRADEPDRSCEALVVLDCSNPKRLGWDSTGCNGSAVINIDHHRDNTRFGSVNIVDTHAAATGEILYRFFAANNIDFPAHVAEALYTAILTDTGGFRFPNTTSEVLHICADLASRGADPANIYDKVYTSHSQTALILQARIWSTVAFHCNGRVCCMAMPQKLLKELNATYSDSEGMADCTIMTAGVDVGFLTKFSETETHFSLRSKGTVDVGKIAQRIPGGGGHSSAAGCTIFKPHAEALAEMLAIIERELEARS